MTSDSYSNLLQPDLASSIIQESQSQLSLKLGIPGQKCIKCGEWKPLDQFYKQGYQNKNGEKDGREHKVYNTCSTCFNLVTQQGRNCFKEKYGCTKGSAEGKRIREDKIGTPCACCGVPMDRPQFDHCHTTNKYRGWLCYNCNVGIGKLGDDLSGLMNAFAYLVRFHETTD